MSPFGLAWRLLWRTTLVWTAVVAVVVASAVAAYQSAYPTEASRQVVVTVLGHNRAFDALYGRPVALETVGGFLAWRYGATATVIIALWALLAVSRLLRGDEDEGRTDLLVAGPVSARSLLVSQLGAFVLATLVISGGTALTCAASGLPIGGSVLFGAMVGAGGLVFGALAAVTSQLVAPRRRAAGWAGGLLGAAYLVRALGDATPARSWMTWTTPLGWIERISPFRDPSWPALGVVVVVSGLLGVVAVGLREHRDTGEGLVSAVGSGRVRTRPITSPLALDWTMARATLFAWTFGVAVTGLVLGFLAVDVVEYMQQDQNINEMTSRIGGASIATINGFLGLSFGVVALVLAVFAGAQVVAAREEEGSGRAENLLTAGAGRVRWLAGRVAVIAGSVVALALVGGVTTWLGVVLSGSGSDLPAALRGSLNVVPVAVLFGGLTVLAFGLLPRATAIVAFGAVALAYVVQLFGSIAEAPGWLLDLSPFAHVAPVPALPADLTSATVMVAIGLVATAAGAVAFARRDIASA